MEQGAGFIIFFFIFGTIFGSFINCLVYRLHSEKTMLGRSFCPKCKHILGFFDLFPIFSYIFLKTRCKYCKNKISVQYFLVELFTGIIFSFGYWFYFINKIGLENNILFLIFYLVISFFLIIIFIYDLKYYLVLDVVVWPGIIIAFLYNFFLLKVDLFSLLIAGVVGVSFFGIQFIFSKGKWIGGGDILIGLLIGFTLGWPKVILAIFISYILGSIIGIILLTFKKKGWSSQLPFGPFLVFSTWLTILFGDIILDWYLSGILGF
jgi:prepilin signal peptidase PulO-like enzyme (type II secretory pathway)